MTMPPAKPGEMVHSLLLDAPPGHPVKLGHYPGPAMLKVADPGPAPPVGALTP
jgi:hypothetical protein